MKKSYYLIGKRLFQFVALTAGLPAMAQTLTTQTVNYTGATQVFTVPACVTSITVSARGAQGGTSGYAGGLGGLANGVMTVVPGQILYLNVGGSPASVTGGFNGGGDGGISPNSTGGAGGGATDIRVGSNSLSARVLVAAGGGGSGGSTSYGATPGAGGAGSSCASPIGVGGAGASGCAAGSAGGCAGGTATSYGTGGGGGGVSSGAGVAGSSTGGFGGAGTFGFGGTGGSYAGATYCNGGGGGGAGYYGGAGGMSGSGGCNGGGGGGSSYADGTVLTNITFPSNATGGNGQMTLSYMYMGPSIAASTTSSLMCAGTTVTLTASGVPTFTWNTSSNNSSIVVVPQTISPNYTVSGTNSFGCISTVVLNMTVYPGAPTLTVASSAPTVCLGQSVTFTASGAYTYTWTGSVVNGTPFVPATTSTYVVSGQNACGTTTAATAVTVAPLPVSVVTTNSVLCPGVTATLTASSAATNYTWMPGGGYLASYIISPTVNTTYTVSVSNGTCSGVNTISVAAYPSPTVTSVISSTNICSGGSITLTANGGLNYTWTAVGSGSIGNGSSIVVTPSASVQYIVAGNNAQGCLASSSQVVIVNQPPVLSLSSSNNIICNGGSSTLIVTGANNYLWSNSSTSGTIVVSPTQLTVYNVSGTNTATGCFTTANISVDVFTPTCAITGNTAICDGNTANLTASGADSYTWSTGLQLTSIFVTPSVTTQYSIAAITTSNGITCPSSANFNVIVNPNPTVTATSNFAQVCKGEPFILTASGASTYSWSNSSTSPTVLITPTVATTLLYFVTGTSSASCVGTGSVQVKVNGCVGINEVAGNTARFVVYPNPSTGDFNIEADKDMELTVINEMGQLVRNISLNEANSRKVNISGLSNGIYMITDGNKGGFNRKVVVNR